MSAGTSEFFCLICLLVCSCTALTNIRAKLGQDVTLPCKDPNIININDITAVEWIRPGLDPDLVLLYRDGRLYPNIQHPSYQNRVDLQDKEVKNGDASLNLKNVTTEDTGRYVCHVSKKGKNEPISIINLKVYLSAQKNITAELGQDVILPCKDPNNNNINNITAVEWIRPGLDPEHVLLYIDGHLDPENQHESYQNRVDLQDKEMKDGNVSLVLKNVTMEDKGTYECRVFEEGKNELINIITLEVLEPDNHWKTSTIIGCTVGVCLVVYILLAFAVYKTLQIRKRKKEKQEEIERLKGNNPETIYQLQQQEQENETLKNEMEKLKGNNSETIKQLQQEKQRNEKAESDMKILQDQLEELMRSHSETSIQFQMVKQRNEFLESRLRKLDPLTEENVHE